MESKAAQPKGPLGVSLLAGALVLGAGPLALVLLLTLVARDEEGAASGLANLIAEGGSFSYAVLFAGALASLVGAVVMGLSVHRPAVPGALALAPFFLAPLAALIGTTSGLSSARAAVAFANPADRAVIMAAATGELMSLQVQALAFAAAACALVALASLVALAAPGRAPRVLAFAGAGLLTPSLGAAAWRIAALMGAFKAVAHASPSDRLTLLLASAEELEGATHLANGALLACLVVVVIGGVVAARFGDRTAAITSAAALLVAAVGFRGLTAATERAMQPPDTGAAPARRLTTLVEGLSPESEAAREGEPPRASIGRWDSRWLGVELEPSLKREALLEFLRTAHAHEADVELVGSAAPVDVARMPVLFKAVATEMSDVRLAVPVRVLYVGEVCASCAGTVTLTKDGLVVGGKMEPRTWKDLGRPVTSYDPPPLVEFAWDGTPDDLVRAGQLALAHGHAIVVRVPAPTE